MSAITTHVLNTSTGRPAAGVPVALTRTDDAVVLGHGVTDSDGRLRDLAADLTLEPGTYSLRFDTEAYFEASNVDGFYPEVVIVFKVRNSAEHYHVPLLLSPFGYSTYRGS